MNRSILIVALAAVALVACAEPSQDATLRPQPVAVADYQAPAKAQPLAEAPVAAVDLAAAPAPAAAPAEPAAAEPAPAEPAAAGTAVSAAQLEAGQKVFASTCMACHQLNGAGIPGAFPPLAKSDYLMADKERSIAIVVKGLSGPITVNGQKFASVMPPLAYLSDTDVANVLTYVRNSFGNAGPAVTPEEVAKVRSGGSPVVGTP